MGKVYLVRHMSDIGGVVYYSGVRPEVAIHLMNSDNLKYIAIFNRQENAIEYCKFVNETRY